MADLLAALLASIQEEAIGFIGGLIFLGSWVLQAWESRQAGSPVVSVRFFVLRALASALLIYESTRAGSLSVTLVLIFTLALMLYNIALAFKAR